MRQDIIKNDRTGEGGVRMSAAEALKYKEALKENRKSVRDMILQSVDDIRKGRGRDYNEFFDELERRYIY